MTMWLKDAAELAIFISCLLNARAFGPTTVAPGVTYAEYVIPGPNRVFVVAVERGRPEYSFAIGWPDLTRNFSKRQTTSRIASLYDQPPHHDVIAAVNASFFGVPPIVIGATASYGEMQEMPGGSRDTLLITTDGVPRMLEDVRHAPGTLVLQDGTTLPIDEYNRAFSTGKMVAYTDGWGAFSSPRDDLTLVVLTGVSRPFSPARPISGLIQTVLTDHVAGCGIAIPHGAVVLAADCELGARLRELARPGDRATIWLGAQHEALGNVDMAVTGVGYIVRGGKPYRSNWRQYEFSTVRHPRTVVAWNESHFFMVVIDGRSVDSVGMTFAEMSDFLTTALHVREALNLDGGGSSTMVVDGIVKNVPSDGSERAVANAMLLVRDAGHDRK